jgi:hypothetical protein
MKKLFPLLSIIVLLFACNKEKIDSNTKDVYVRLKNVSGLTLENAHVDNTIYGNVSSNKTTSYKLVNTPVYTGFCSFTSDGIEKTAGYGFCGSPMPPAFEPGYYTFKVEPAISGFHLVTVTKQ